MNNYIKNQIQYHNKEIEKLNKIALKYPDLEEIKTDKLFNVKIRSPFCPDKILVSKFVIPNKYVIRSYDIKINTSYYAILYKVLYGYKIYSFDSFKCHIYRSKNNAIEFCNYEDNKYKHLIKDREIEIIKNSAVKINLPPRLQKLITIL